MASLFACRSGGGGVLSEEGGELVEWVWVWVWVGGGLVGVEACHALQGMRLRFVDCISAASVC